MAARAASNPEGRSVAVPSLPAFERLVPHARAEDLVSQIDAWTKPGEVVLDLTGRGGWVARAAIAEQRRAADFEAWALTRLFAEVVLRPPDLRQIDAAASALAAASFSGSTVRRTIDSLYASTCPRCGGSVTLDSMTWSPLGSGGEAEPKGKRGKGRSVAKAQVDSAGGARLRPVMFGGGEAWRALGREYRCEACHGELGGAEVRSVEPTPGDIKLAVSVSSSGDVREAMRHRFPAPRSTHPLVDQLIDLHTPRQLLGLHAILVRIDSEERVGAVTAALRLALLHAVTLAGRLAGSSGKPAPVRIANGALRVPAAREWRERNPWSAFEEGLREVRVFVQALGAASPRSAVARLAPDLASLEGGTSNVTLIESTPASLRRLGLHGERMAHSASPSRVRLVLGQAPLPMTQDRLATLYHGTGWIFGAGAVSMLPYDALFRPAAKTTDAQDNAELARSIGRTLAVASPALSNNGRAVILLDDDRPETLLAAALGGAAAGCRLLEGRLHRGDDRTPGIAVFVPPTGSMSPGARTRANRPLPPLAGGAGDPGTVQGRGVFARPERVDRGAFNRDAAAVALTETVTGLLRARGEPATFDHMIGDLLVGLDRSGQLARLARELRPSNADDGWSAWIDDTAEGGHLADGVAVDAAAAGIRRGAGPRAMTGREPGSADGAGPAGAGGAPGAGAAAEIAEPEAGPSPGEGLVERLLGLMHEELERPNNRRIRQVEPGQFWLGSEEDRSKAAQPLADRVEWAAFSLLSSAVHLSERAAIDRTMALFRSPDVPDGALVEACLRSYSAPASTAEEIVPSDVLERRAAEHDAVIATLADLGHRMGMRVWIGQRQQSRLVGGRPLSGHLDADERAVHLPLIAWAPEGELERVDCAWYVRRRASFLFEVEWTAMLGEPILVHHARYPADDKVVRFLVLPPERAELAKLKLARSPLLRRAIEERNWHFLKWNHLVAFAARPEVALENLEPYLGLEAPADAAGEQLPLF